MLRKFLEKSKKLFQETAALKIKDQWTETMNMQSMRFLANGGHLSMLEIMLLQGLLEIVRFYRKFQEISSFLCFFLKHEKLFFLCV